MSDINERIYQEEPIIAGVKVRPYSMGVKLKLHRLMRWLPQEGEEQAEEMLLAFLYLIAAPIERVAINTLNREAYLVDKDRFLETLTTEDLKAASEWFVTVTGLEKETEVEVVPKPSSSTSKDQPPPNS